MTWQQGEHLAVIGQTGSGKTYLMRALLERMRWVIMLRTKSDRINLPRGPHGYQKIRDVRGIGSGDRYELVPLYERQKAEAEALCEAVYRAGGWTVCFDELYYAIAQLRLDKPITRLLTQGRSLGITVVTGMQRPVSITRFALSEATHIFCFGLEGRDVVTLAEATTPRIKEIVSQLRRYEYVYFNRRTRELITGRADTLDAVLGPAPERS